MSSTQEESAYQQAEDGQLTGTSVLASWTCAILLGLTTGTILITTLAIFKEGDDGKGDSPDEKPRLVFPSCVSQACKSTAEALTMTLSSDVDPCDDLFGFVCRRYPADAPRTFGESHNRVVAHAIAILFKTPAPASRRAPAVQKAAVLLRSCMRFFMGAQTHGQAQAAANNALSNIMAEFQLSLEFSQSSRQVDPCETIIDLGLKYNIEIFLKLTAGNDLGWRKRDSIKISWSKEDVLWYETVVKDIRFVKIMYESYYEEFTGNSWVDAVTFASDVGKLEQNISHILQNIPLKADEDPSYKLKPLVNLPSNFQNSILRNGPGFFYHQSSVFVDPKATQIAAELNKMPKKEANFAIAYTILRKYGKYSSPRIVSKFSTKPLARQLCVARVSEAMPGAFAAAYLFSMISNSTIQLATNIALRTRESFIAAVFNSTSLENTFSSAIAAKLRTMEFYVAFPKIIADVNKMNAFYEFVDVKEQDYFFASWMKAMQAVQRRRMSDVSGAVYPVYRSDVFYIAHSSRLVVMAPAMLPTLFLPDGPLSWNYGGLGVRIGRGIMHGYDINGTGYDPLGQKEDWLTPSVKQHYMNFAQCVQEAAQRFADHKLRSKSLVELSSDVVGLQMAVESFKLNAAQNSQVLPWLPFTPLQLLFLAHCYRWCEFSDEENDLHSQHRCNVPAMNTVQYSNAFNCTRTDRMNPEKKCTFF